MNIKFEMQKIFIYHKILFVVFLPIFYHQKFQTEKLKEL